MDRVSALSLLRTGVDDETAEFRDDQWEIIDALVNRREKVLLVQRTGWGKSAVYFITASMLRQQGFGVTLIVSPLVGLMRNQVRAGQRMGLRIGALHSGTNDRLDKFCELVRTDGLDILLVAPERFANHDFLDRLLPIIVERTGLLVIDEAHCISDWGNDFRPDYRRLSNIIQQLPPNSALLATTATANDRVIKDIGSQLGNVRISRGSLNRENLALQTMPIMSGADRLAWLAQVIPSLPGKGIIYTLTTRDAEQVAGWLGRHGVSAHAYHGSITTERYPDPEDARKYLEESFLTGDLAIMVATSALGMGYDNPHVRFVIHYQCPASVITYYQQVGRAGRGQQSAFGILLSGPEDADINQYFRTSSLPTGDDVRTILTALEEVESATSQQLESVVNMQRARVERTLKYLSVESPAPLVRAGSRWQRTPVPWNAADQSRQEALIATRESEWRDMQRYLALSDACQMHFLLEALDDPSAGERCGRCENCIGASLLPTVAGVKLARQAQQFIVQSAEHIIAPRRQIPRGAFRIYGFPTSIPASLRAQEGRTLCKWGDEGWGRIVALEKSRGAFGDTLVAPAIELIEARWRSSFVPEWVTCIPSSQHPNLVPDFARRIADRLTIPFFPIVVKTRKNAPQKLQDNSFHQCRNLDGMFRIDGRPASGPVLLVDDMVDSGWTFTVVALLLRQAGSGPVFPFALASTKSGDT